MQYLVAGWYGAQALWLASLPFWYINVMTQYANAMNAQEARLNPGSPTPPPGFVSSTDTVMAVAFYAMTVVVLAIVVVAIIGALKRWTWAHYAILALLGLEAIYLVLGFAGTLIESFATSALLGQSIGPPAWMLWADLGFGIPSAALFAWMLIATFQRGPWAMKRAPLAEQ
jgi:hypothetical protein